MWCSYSHFEYNCPAVSLQTRWILRICTYFEVDRDSPGRRRSDALSTCKSISSYSRHQPLRRNRGAGNSTCSAPISLSGRLLTTEFVNFANTKLDKTSCSGDKRRRTRQRKHPIPRHLIEKVLEIFLLLNQRLNKLGKVFHRFRELIHIT